jgi:hypothetical protein
MIIAAALLMLATSAGATASLTYLECSIAGDKGMAHIWRITLNPQTGSADMGIVNTMPHRVSAAFQTDRVILSHGDTSRFEINRRTLKILTFRRSDNVPADGGQCKLLAPPDKLSF